MSFINNRRPRRYVHLKHSSIALAFKQLTLYQRLEMCEETEMYVCVEIFTKSIIDFPSLVELVNCSGASQVLVHPGRVYSYA